MDLQKTRPEVSGEAPLFEATFLILLSLQGEPRHGYAILKEVEALSQGRVALSTGTLYGAIKRLLADRWIERVETAGTPENGRERKPYRLTERGEHVLAAEVRRLRALVNAADKRGC